MSVESLLLNFTTIFANHLTLLRSKHNCPITPRLSVSQFAIISVLMMMRKKTLLDIHVLSISGGREWNSMAFSFLLLVDLITVLNLKKCAVSL